MLVVCVCVSVGVHGLERDRAIILLVCVRESCVRVCEKGRERERGVKRSECGWRYGKSASSVFVLGVRSSDVGW